MTSTLPAPAALLSQPGASSTMSMTTVSPAATTEDNTTGNTSNELSLSPTGSSKQQLAQPQHQMFRGIAKVVSLENHRGHVFFGPYQLLQTLGEGEFGKVKLASFEYRQVAIKFVRKTLLSTRQRREKIVREIEIMKTVRHKHIVGLYDVLESEKYVGLVVEFASGGELFDHILAHRYLKETEARKYFGQLISGVRFLHQLNIVHRDLKLENLLLDGSRNIKITDFGFANYFQSSADHLMKTSCGSPCYAAPELVLTDGYVGTVADVWSCGVILYAMLCGYLPFDDDPDNPDSSNVNKLYSYIMNTTLTYPLHVSKEAQNLCTWLLQPDPMKRCTIDEVLSHPWMATMKQYIYRTCDNAEGSTNIASDDSKENATANSSVREHRALSNPSEMSGKPGGKNNMPALRINTATVEPPVRGRSNTSPRLATAHPIQQGPKQSLRSAWYDTMVSEKAPWTAQPATQRDSKGWPTRHATPISENSVMDFPSVSENSSTTSRRRILGLLSRSNTTSKVNEHDSGAPVSADVVSVTANKFSVPFVPWLNNSHQSIASSSVPDVSRLHITKSPSLFSPRPLSDKSSSKQSFNPWGTIKSFYERGAMKTHRGPLAQSTISTLPPPVIVERVYAAMTAGSQSQSPPPELSSPESCSSLLSAAGKVTVELCDGLACVERTGEFTLSCVWHSKQASSTASSSSDTNISPPESLSDGSLRPRSVSIGERVKRSLSLLRRPFDVSTTTAIEEAKENNTAEVSFTVQVCKVRSFEGMYTVEFKRLRGDAWLFKRIYETIVGRLDLADERNVRWHDSAPRDTR